MDLEEVLVSIAGIAGTLCGIGLAVYIAIIVRRKTEEAVKKWLKNREKSEDENKNQGGKNV